MCPFLATSETSHSTKRTNLAMQPKTGWTSSLASKLMRRLRRQRALRSHLWVRGASHSSSSRRAWRPTRWLLKSTELSTRLAITTSRELTLAPPHGKRAIRTTKNSEHRWLRKEVKSCAHESAFTVWAESAKRSHASITVSHQCFSLPAHFKFHNRL